MNLLLEEHFTNLNVFRATVKLGVLHQFNGGLIVLIEGDRFGEFDAKFSEKMAKEEALLCQETQGHVFGFGGR